jgi:hypothetical protein
MKLVNIMKNHADIVVRLKDLSSLLMLVSNKILLDLTKCCRLFSTEYYLVKITNLPNNEFAIIIEGNLQVNVLFK